MSGFTPWALLCESLEVGSISECEFVHRAIELGIDEETVRLELARVRRVTIDGIGEDVA